MNMDLQNSNGLACKIVFHLKGNIKANLFELSKFLCCFFYQKIKSDIFMAQVIKD